MNKRIIIACAIVLLLVLGTWLLVRQPQKTAETGKILTVVATTNIVGDLVQQIAGSYIQLDVLMGAGVDPHLYKASEGDVRRLSRADLIIYSGLHLEGKMVELFEQMQARGKPTVALAEDLTKESLLTIKNYAGNFDPHVWFDVALWAQAITVAQKALSTIDPQHANIYENNGRVYQQKLQALDAQVRQAIASIPTQQRVLVTAHDAFSYFGRAYGMEVRGLLGVSTASEAGAADVTDLANFIIARKIPAVFVETTISQRYLQALQAAVAAQGYNLHIGGSLYSDALGSPNEPTGTYIGMVEHNITQITQALQNPLQPLTKP